MTSTPSSALKNASAAAALSSFVGMVYVLPEAGLPVTASVTCRPAIPASAVEALKLAAPTLVTIIVLYEACETTKLSADQALFALYV
eukprot:CAMPEP_0203980666 /NCGR_PEP_ID=MMETSP0360-20130528/1620_1 /ASSEMBLY_ACC=CAM_ASM_000342 /TAXON_ID=268821 /ORGANISM="Scrippsiella Hangoei, Strain SHTV-5" /LENGTH=86 /DNA_ID=CAMNT_0050919097 /DNA_START=7 /DNA_END=264 /DNA_ORIENTATION=+